MKRPWVILLVAVFVALAVGLGIGLRLRPRGDQFARLGGLDVTFRIDTAGLKDNELAIVTDETAQVLRKRFDPNGRRGVVVVPGLNYRIRLQLPGFGFSREEAADAIALATNMGKLEFRLVAKNQDEVKLDTLQRGESVEGYAYYRYAASAIRAMPGGVSDKGLLVVTNDGYDITGDLLKRVYPSNDPGGPAIGFEMNPDGAKRFARMTGEHVGEQIAIIVNGEIYSAPVVRMQISSTGVINGLEDQKEADMLVKALSSGSLKAPLIVEQESFVGAAIPKGRWWW